VTARVAPGRVWLAFGFLLLGVALAVAVSVLAGAAPGIVALAWLLVSGSHGGADAGGGPGPVDAGGGDTGSGGVA
jgi:hypothetical protein